MKYNVIIIQQDDDGNMERLCLDQTFEPWEMRQLAGIGQRLHRTRPPANLAGQTTIDGGDAA